MLMSELLLLDVYVTTKLVQCLFMIIEHSQLQDHVDDDWEEDIKALIREEEAERKRKMSLNIPSPLDFVSVFKLLVYSCFDTFSLTI